MAVYLDPPRWPAHGTMFSHLISNESLEELHTFAAAAGIPERAFDRDHYDVPERRREDLIAQGAIAVEARELTRLLIASGLRVPARQRSESLETALRLRWEALLPDAVQLAAELLERWAEPHRHYHSRTHLLAVLEALELLDDQLPRPVALAAWFHDAVYNGIAGQDEEDSAQLAETLLGVHLPATEVLEVARLVRLTATHDPQLEDRNGSLLCDADLAVLGGSAEDYARYRHAVRQDYSHVPEADFRRGRAAVLRQLLALNPLYRSASAQKLWGSRAVENLQTELSELETQLG